MSLNEINPANSLKTGVDSFTGLPGSISDINRDLFGQSLSKPSNSVLGGIPMNPLLESDDRSISAIQTKARSGASSVYGNEREIFPIDRAAQQVGKALMDDAITAPLPIGDRVDRAGGYDELLNPNPSNFSATVRSGDTQKELGTGSDWRELQKADGNGFTEREAYKLPGKNVFPDKDVYVVVEKDTLSKIAQDKFGDANRWKELLQKTADGSFKGFTEQEAEQLQIGTKVYIPGYWSFDDDNNLLFKTLPSNAQRLRNIESERKGRAARDAWKKYYEECRKDDIDKVFIERFWIDSTTKKKMKFKKLTWENIKTGNTEQDPPNSPEERSLDIVTISKDGTVTGIEVKATEEEAQKKRSREQEARDNNALERKGQIRDPNDEKQLYTPTSVIRFVEKVPPDCDDPDHRKKHDDRRSGATVRNVKVDPNPNSQNNPVESEEDPGVEVEPPNIDSPPKPQDYRLPVGSEKDSEEDPEVDVERRRPKPRTINPPRFNVPARPPAIESPKPIDAPARPRTEPPLDAPARPRTEPPLDAPASPARPPIDDAPARPPVRPPASTTVLNGVSRVARPLGVVTDIIDLTNAYNEDGGFGENFQETAGSVAGGWGGAAAGAALGTALIPIPVVGTVLGGIAGGIIGSGAGEGIVKGVRDFFG
ncbi:hypothetical protein QUA20_13560 [Microcoleus sp. Pol7_A1]|uniref:hypothetical protein n=1 Tax=Microcoleus sp. Pol7_A1 TaxID=2818893 RepID=UPI002FD5992A